MMPETAKSVAINAIITAGQRCVITSYSIHYTKLYEGIVFTFSCSQVVTKDKFREAVFSAAAIAGRNVRILHQLTQPADHPVNIYHPESEYLKGLVLYVE